MHSDQGLARCLHSLPEMEKMFNTNTIWGSVQKKYYFYLELQIDWGLLLTKTYGLDVKMLSPLNRVSLRNNNCTILTSMRSNDETLFSPSLRLHAVTSHGVLSVLWDLMSHSVVSGSLIKWQCVSTKQCCLSELLKIILLWLFDSRRLPWVISCQSPKKRRWDVQGDRCPQKHYTCTYWFRSNFWDIVPPGWLRKPETTCWSCLLWVKYLWARHWSPVEWMTLDSRTCQLLGVCVCGGGGHSIPLLLLQVGVVFFAYTPDQIRVKNILCRMAWVRGAGTGGEKLVKPLRLQGHSSLSSHYPQDP